jgi:hypothetical protein
MPAARERFFSGTGGVGQIGGNMGLIVDQLWYGIRPFHLSGR